MAHGQVLSTARWPMGKVLGKARWPTGRYGPWERYGPRGMYGGRPEANGQVRATGRYGARGGMGAGEGGVRGEGHGEVRAWTPQEVASHTLTSVMPPMGALMKPEEIRDVISYLAELK